MYSHFGALSSFFGFCLVFYYWKRIIGFAIGLPIAYVRIIYQLANSWVLFDTAQAGGSGGDVLPLSQDVARRRHNAVAWLLQFGQRLQLARGSRVCSGPTKGHDRGKGQGNIFTL